MADLGLAGPPVLWRILLALAADPDAGYASPFVGATVPRRFHYLWRFVCRREHRRLRRRLQTWYSEDLDAAPGSHEPLARRVAAYPAAFAAEDRAYCADLSSIQRTAHGLLLVSMPLVRRHLDDLRHRYRFFGVGDEVWIDGQNLGRGQDLG